MTDMEYRALLEFHAKELQQLTRERSLGYGLLKKETILKHLERMQQLAENLEG